MRKNIYIEGMTCVNCARLVEIEMSKLTGVEAVKVNLQTKCATVILDHPIKESNVSDLLDDMGYKLIEIK